MLAAARAAIGWRTIDAELAELIADSAVDEPALLVRGTAQPRTLTFEAPGLTIEIEAEHAPPTACACPASSSRPSRRTSRSVRGRTCWRCAPTTADTSPPTGSRAAR